MIDCLHVVQWLTTALFKDEARIEYLLSLAQVKRHHQLLYVDLSLFYAVYVLTLDANNELAVEACIIERVTVVEQISLHALSGVLLD